MRSLDTIRGTVGVALASMILMASVSARAQFGGRGGGARPAPVVRESPQAQTYARQQAPAPIERRAPGTPVNGGVRSGAMVKVNPAVSPKGHLNEWMGQHSNLTPTQQRQALEREPGFQRLPPQEQQRLRDRFTQLEAMPQQQRQRMLERTEAMERLSPEQRGQVRGAMQQLGSLPMDQRQTVARSFRELRTLPPEQRMAAMNSVRYQNLNGEQRATLGNLIRVEPMLPPAEGQPR